MRDWAWYRGNAANFLTMACHMSVVTLLPLFWKRQGLSDGEIGWLAAGFSVSAILARSCLGGWLDQQGRRPFLYLGCLLLTTLPLSYPFWGHRFFPWCALRVLQGAGYGLYITAILTWVADRSPPDRIAQGQGVFGVSGLLGSAVGPMACEAIYQLYGFRPMFWSLGVAGLLATALMTSLPESSPSEPLHETSLPVAGLRWADHRATVGVTIPFGWVVGTIITFIAPYGDSLELPSVALYFVGFALASISVRLGSGGFIDRISPTRLVYMAGGLIALSALALAGLHLAPMTGVLFCAALLNGIGHGFLFPGLSAHTVRLAGAQQTGAGIALFTGLFDSGVLLGSVTSGYISQTFGYPSAFLVAGLLLLAALPAFGALHAAGLQPEPQRAH